MINMLRFLKWNRKRTQYYRLDNVVYDYLIYTMCKDTEHMLHTNVIQKLQADKMKLDQILDDKVEPDLERFQQEIKGKNPVSDREEYDKLTRRIKICALKKEVNTIKDR